MILTYKIKHQRDFSDELRKARQVAEFAIKHGTQSSKDVKQFGLKSVIANQILRKYGRSTTAKQVSHIKLTIPKQGIRYTDTQIYVPCLRFELHYQLPDFQKINQIEIGDTYAYISVTIPDTPEHIATSWMGIDLNATGHCAVVANPTTGKVIKLGKQAPHIHTQYRNRRRKLQRKCRWRAVKQMKNRESRKVRDLNHKMAQRIVNEAKQTQAGIVLEDLTGIRKTKKQAKSFRGTLHSWSFYQLKMFIQYKAKLHGVPVVQIDPRYTSQQCSRCGQLGMRSKKKYMCPHCGHVAHADVNAAFVIALRQMGVLQLPIAKDVGKGRTDTPGVATARRRRPQNPRT